jgi:transcriptional regulator with XRE-family HTH domain
VSLRDKDAMARSRKSRYAPDYRILLTMLVQARHAADVTQEDLSDRLRTSQSMLSKLERGVVRMDLIDTFDYLLALGLDPVGFLKTFLDTAHHPKGANSPPRAKRKAK